ncbi:MAG TPA: hypothetical protein VNN79_00475 [Actinomycetota bacterium]|nr:hypothetical protein [Actinomycetota bacterium]
MRRSAIRTRWRWRRALLAGGLALLALTAAACGGGTGDGGSPSPPTHQATSRPSSPVTVTIVTPKNGEQFQAGEKIPVVVKLTGAKIVKQSTTNITPTTGHLHMYVDDAIVSMNYQTTNTLTEVKPGMHVMKVEFVAADHLPFDPRIIQAVTFQVTP